MTDTPFFTVVVPAYNQAAMLPATLASVRAQTVTDFELIVVDDGSVDDSSAVAEAHGADRVIRQPNGGVASARNTGIAAARSPYVSVLDGDDFWLPDYLETMKGLLESRPGVAVAYGDAYIYDDRRRRIARRTAYQWYRPEVVPTDPEAFFLALLETNWIFGSTTFSKEVIESVGGYDESLRLTEDWNLWLRVSGAGHPIVGTTKPVGLYRHHDTQVHSATQAMLDTQVRCIAGVLELPGLPPHLREATEARVAHQAALAAAGGDDPTWRRLIRPLIRPLRGVKDFRRDVPAEVGAAFPHLFDRP